jgi:hypothetical protein
VAKTTMFIGLLDVLLVDLKSLGRRKVQTHYFPCM